MSYIKLYNKSQEDINFLTSISKKLKPFLSLVEKSEYPIIVTVLQKKNKNDLSSLDLNNNKITLKYSSKLQSKQDIAFVFIHEIFHWICLKNHELKKVAFSEENKYIDLLQKKYKNKDFHDAYAYEIISNFMATVLIGKFHKRHFLNKKNIK